MRQFRLGGKATFAALGLSAAALLFAAAACDRSEPAGAAGQAPAASTQPASDAAESVRALVRQEGAHSASDSPHDHAHDAAEPATPHAPASDSPIGGSPATRRATLVYTAPETWQREPVRSRVRDDQYRLPRAEGDAEDGELAVFASGIRGTVEENIARWRGQFTTPDGQPLPDDAVVRETLEVHGLTVTLVDLAGSYNPGAMMPGMTASAPATKDNYRMLGAIVETPGGPWFCKALGPAATIGQHRDEFVQFLHSLHAE